MPRRIAEPEGSAVTKWVSGGLQQNSRVCRKGLGALATDKENPRTPVATKEGEEERKETR
jgi:hypothetical protein